MKRASVIISVLLLSGALIAQVHGVPASVTSFGPGRSMAPGVPASVTSLGPNGYSHTCNQPACLNPGFPYSFAPLPPGVHGTHNGHHGGHHRPVTGGYGYGGYAYVPYAYPVAVEPEEDDAADAAVATGPEEPDAPAPTVFERRPVAQPAPYVPIERSPEEAASAETQEKHVNLSPVSEEKIPVVVVFRDGHQQEIANGNYAIVGDTLYDLSGAVAHKIKLADLDLSQTVQLNEQRGVDFSLPAAYKPQA